MQGVPMGVNAVNVGYHTFRRKEAGIYCPSPQHFLSNHYFERASYQYSTQLAIPENMLTADSISPQAGIACILLF